MKLRELNLSSGVPIFCNLLSAQAKIEGVFGVFGSRRMERGCSVNENSSAGLVVFMLVLIGERTFLKGLVNVVFFWLVGDDLTVPIDLSSWFGCSSAQIFKCSLTYRATAFEMKLINLWSICECSRIFELRSEKYRMKVWYLIPLKSHQMLVLFPLWRPQWQDFDPAKKVQYLVLFFSSG